MMDPLTQEAIDSMREAMECIKAQSARITELENAIWHALDDGEDRKEEYAITWANFEKLSKLVPEEHP